MKNRIRRALFPTGRSALAAVALAAAFVSACDVHGVSEVGTLSSIVVTPNATIASNATQQMTAVGLDGDGRVVTITPVWSVAASGGTINSSGMFTAGTVTGLFTNTVVATVGGISGRASITVTPGAIASITVVPNPVTLAVAAKQQFIAVAKDGAGNIVNFTPTWSVVAGGGSIDSIGNFTAAGTPGTYANTVQASNNAIKGFATVIVTIGPLATIAITPNPDTLIVSAKQQFTAVGKDASGNSIAIVTTWSIVAGGGTVDGGGLFTAGPTPGTYTNTLKATSGTLSSTATIVVTPGPLATIKVTPNPATMTLSATQQFVAVGADVAGNPVAIVPTWAVVAGGGATNATGLFTAGLVSGTFTNTMRASYAGMSGFATVIVTSGPLASITVTPNPVSMPAGSIQQFIAVGKDANGNVFIMSPVWSVVNGGGTIDALGVFTAGVTANTFLNTVKATSGLISGLATVTVTTPAPPPPFVNLGAATTAGILGATAVTCGLNGTINADVMLSPGAAVDPACIVTGTKHIDDATAVQAQIDMNTAFNTLMGLPCPGANIRSDLAGTTVPAGVYCSPALGQMLATGGVTLDGGGNPNAVFVFQVGSSFTSTGSVNLIGQAQAKNVYWVVGASATIGGGGWQGNILAYTTVTLNSATTLVGRALAHTGAVTIGTGNITLP
jgi:hypothetical protein